MASQRAANSAVDRPDTPNGFQYDVEIKWREQGRSRARMYEDERKAIYVEQMMPYAMRAVTMSRHHQNMIAG